jgi:hypothetical protein
MSRLQYKGYFDFSGGYNDSTSEDSLKDNELSALTNAVITEQNAIKIRNGTSPIGDNKGYNITQRFEYLVRDNSIILEIYNKKLYKTDLVGDDELILSLNSDKAYFLQQQDVLYVCNGANIYEIGGKDYYSNVTATIKSNDIVQITDDFSAVGIRGHFYKALANLGEIDLSAENYNNSARWEDCTDIVGATSSIARILKAYEAGKKEIVKLSVFNTVIESGYITINLHGTNYDVNLSSGDSARTVASKIATATFPGYSATAKQNVVTFIADSIGYREDCYVETYDTGVSIVVYSDVQGEADDNILNEVRNCTKFIQHTKSGRYVATGNPKKPHAVYFSEPYQLNYFKQFNVLSPTSSEGSVVCLLNLLDSIVVGYKHSWYEYTGIEPSTDGEWRRLAIPYGCASEYSVQVLNLYNFVYLADNGLYLVSANILSQYGVAMQNTSTVKCISDEKVENTIKLIDDKSKCVSVYHDGVYYLAFGTEVKKPNNKILLYYVDKKAYTLFEDIQVNDFLYRRNGQLEFASMNYSLNFRNVKYVDFNPVTEEEVPIKFIMTTSNLALDNHVAQKFIDKIFINANIGAENFDRHLSLGIAIDDIELDSMLINLQKLNIGLVWGELWGSPWGNYSTNLQSAFIREKGNRITITFTNILNPEIDTNIIIYGFAISYIALTPHQPIANINFS